VAAAAPVTATASPIRRWLPWAAAAVAVALAVAAATRRPAVPGEVRLEFSTPPTTEPALTISPDGRTVAFVSLIDGRRQISLRRLDDSEARPLPGTDNANTPFWSPDGRSIGFFANGRLNLASLETGTVRAFISGLPGASGATLNADNILLYSSNPGSPVSRLSIPDGTPTAATRFSSGHRQHAFPSFLPDGRHFLFFVSTQSNDRGIHVGQLDNLESRHLVDSDGSAVFSAASGCLFFLRDGKLVAQRFDPDRLELGPDVIAVDPRGSGAFSLAASPTGALVYRTPPLANDRRQLAWVDRSGTETHRVIYQDTLPLGPALSRDGRQVAVFRYTDDNIDLWNYDTVRGTWDRLTFDAGDDIYPLWSSEGRRLIFGSRRGTMDLYSLTLGGGPGSERLELRTPQPKFPTDWSPDDRVVLFNTIDPASGVDIAALHLDGTRQSVDVVKTPANEQHAQFSPDGRWIAYQSDKTGRDEIYLRPYPGPGADVPVSTNGGSQVRWNPRGEELFYIAADDRLMSVPIVERSGQLEPGAATALFPTTVGSTAPNTNRQQYSVSADGRTFLMNGLVEPARSSPVTVLLNWMPPK
jgi:Tol biopolymer transport system component